MFCPNCGANNEDGAQICSFCRIQLRQPVPVEQPQPSQPVNMYAQPQPSQPVNMYAQPQPSQPVNMYAQPQPISYGYGPKMSKEEFYKHPYNAQMSKSIKVNAIILYIVFALTFFVNVGIVVAASTNDYLIGMKLFIVDEIVSVGTFMAILIAFFIGQELLALFAHIKQNFVCAILLAVSILVFALIIGFSIGTFIWLACTILHAVQLYRFNKAYQNYCRAGVM